MSSGATVLRAGKDGSEGIDLPPSLGDPCLIGGEVVAADYDGAVAAQPDRTLPGPNAPLSGSLRRFDGDGWAPVPDSSFDYVLGDDLELRCSDHGLELTGPGEIASELWDGSGAWRDLGSPPEIDWSTSPQLDGGGGLVGAVDGSIVRLDSTTGKARASATAPGGAERRWGGSMAIGTTDPTVGVDCAVERTGDQDRVTARCETFGT